ncbi:urea ABC transporter ATP-binding protein UrtD [Rubritalea profundi]|jgi:urea transport system ATP-binding protein|uniref:Urea ABC transporter ATP-binding protein UrtD n=1 Tax=Rubritalea profundi TaxID=1658618 RepID=A0A2S7U3R2_9BACT|nr:urea ABC transporter ATP-binding protein UrtD [Rubritalea profundi]PQJ29034.1 urea ABC transporter ATP-binding protein UrtD [Rubritalea profundi]
MSHKPLYKDTDLVLSIESVMKSFDGFRAINDLNFYLGEGELRTIIGPNGAGKSTFMDLITGRTRPDEGSLIYHQDDGHDMDLTKLREYEINRLGISRKFQAPSVYQQHTVYDNIVLSLNKDRSVLKSLFYRVSADDREFIDEILGTIRLKGMINNLAGSLSHGQKQWLEIGMLLAQQPRILLVDEPAAGMSDEETERTGELLLSLEGKHSIIVVEHDMEFIRQIARKVTVLHQGHVIKEGKFLEVANDPTVKEVYLGRQKHE